MSRRALSARYRSAMMRSYDEALEALEELNGFDDAVLDEGLRRFYAQDPPAKLPKPRSQRTREERARREGRS